MNYRRIFILLISLTGFLFSQASVRLSLQAAIDKALQNREEIKISQLQVASSVNQQKRLQAKRLPQVSSDLDIRYNPQRQAFIIPPGLFGPQGQQDAVRFGTPFNVLFDFNLNQSLFDPVNHGDRKIASAQLQYDQLNEKKVGMDIQADVMQAYFSALLWKEKTDLSYANYIRNQFLYVTEEGSQKNGISTSYDLQHTKLDMDNAQSTYLKNKNSYKLSLQALAYRMGTPDTTIDSLTDNLLSLYQKYLGVLSTDNFTIQRPELLIEKKQKDIYALNYAKTNLTYIPTVNFYANYSFQYLSPNFNLASKTWYPYNYLGVKASIPIFDGLEKEKIKKDYLLKQQSSQLNYTKLLKDYTEDAQTAISGFKNASIDLNYQEHNLIVVNQLYSLDSSRLLNGTIKPNDLRTTYYSVQETQNNYISAVYDYLTQVINYLRAVGNL